MRAIPILESERLVIRPFLPTDLPYLFPIKQAIGWVDEQKTAEQQQAAEADYLAWSVLNHRHLAQLGQPPYGDRAVVLKENNRLIGSVGLVPCLDVYGQFPSFGAQQNCLATAEVGGLPTPPRLRKPSSAMRLARCASIASSPPRSTTTLPPRPSCASWA